MDKKVIELATLSSFYIESETVSASTLTSYVNKLTLTVTPSFTGKYILRWQLELANSVLKSRTKFRLRDDATTWSESIIMPTGTKDEMGWILLSGFKQFNLVINTNYNFYLDFAPLLSTGYVKFARLFLERVF